MTAPEYRVCRGQLFMDDHHMYIDFIMYTNVQVLGEDCLKLQEYKHWFIVTQDLLVYSFDTTMFMCC